MNNKSGSANSTNPIDIVDLFAKHGFAIDVLTPRDGNSISDLAKQVAQQDYAIVVAGGGDGTINAVASALVGHSATRLGILPLGTLNHFARDLGIPSDIFQAVKIICAAHTQATDVGAVNELYFVNNASVGLYPAIVRIRENLQLSGYSKWWAALISLFRALSNFRRFELEIRPTKGPATKIKTAMLFVGNNAYETVGAKMGTRSAVDRGMLWINTPTSSSRFGICFNFVSMLLGRTQPPDSLILQSVSFKVASKKRLLKIATDGEVTHLKTPLNFRILPKALNVIVPVPSSGT